MSKCPFSVSSLPKNAVTLSSNRMSGDVSERVLKRCEVLQSANARIALKCIDQVLYFVFKHFI